LEVLPTYLSQTEKRKRKGAPFKRPGNRSKDPLKEKKKKKKATPSSSHHLEGGERASSLLQGGGTRWERLLAVQRPGKKGGRKKGVGPVTIISQARAGKRGLGEKGQPKGGQVFEELGSSTKGQGKKKSAEAFPLEKENLPTKLWEKKGNTRQKVEGERSFNSDHGQRKLKKKGGLHIVSASTAPDGGNLSEHRRRDHEKKKENRGHPNLFRNFARGGKKKGNWPRIVSEPKQEGCQEKRSEVILSLWRTGKKRKGKKGGLCSTA